MQKMEKEIAMVNLLGSFKKNPLGGAFKQGVTQKAEEQWTDKELAAKFGPVDRALSRADTAGELQMASDGTGLRAETVVAKTGLDVIKVTKAHWELCVKELQKARLAEVVAFLRTVGALGKVTYEEVLKLAATVTVTKVRIHSPSESSRLPRRVGSSTLFAPLPAMCASLGGSSER